MESLSTPLAKFLMPQENLENLMSDAFQLLENGEPQMALEAGEKLERLRYSGGFEIQALAYAELGKKKKAIKALERGLEEAPDIWVLWQLLGNYYSDEGQMEKAWDAFDNGLQTEQTDRVSLLYNYAAALGSAHQYDKALQKISEIQQDEHFPDDTEEDLYLLIQHLRLSLLNNLRQYQDAIKLYAQLEDTVVRHEKDCPSELSCIYAEVGKTFLNLADQAKAKTYLKKAVERDNQNEIAHWLHREIYGDKDYKKAKYYRIVVQGKWHEPVKGEEELPEFFATYEVVADNEEEALEIIKFFEPIPTHDSLKIKSAKTLKSRSQPKGVYQHHGYSFSPEDGDPKKGG